VDMKAQAFMVSTWRYLAKPWCFPARSGRAVRPSAFMNLTHRSEDRGFGEAPRFLQVITDLAAYLQPMSRRGRLVFLFFGLVSSRWMKLWALVCSEPGIAEVFFALQTFHLNHLVIINV